MGGAVSSGRDNSELIDNLVSGNYIRTLEVERVMRALDRADYMTPEARDQAYKDLAWRNGPLHLSSPCIYSEVMEGLDLKPGLSFLNIGSGTGYLSTLVGLVLGTSGISHGVEVHPSVVEYAVKKIAQFLENSPVVDDFDFCEPKFYQGNGLCLTPLLSCYDRVYCGAGCPPEYEDYFKKLIKVGGILVMPLNDNLQQIKRVSETKWVTRSLLNVSFATLRTPTKEEVLQQVKLDKQTPVRLQLLARSVVRHHMRLGVMRRNPELIEKPRKPLPPACPRRICIPIDPNRHIDMNELHDLDTENGANEMNALLSLVISMGHNRVAGALRFDRIDNISTSEDEDNQLSEDQDQEDRSVDRPQPNAEVSDDDSLSDSQSDEPKPGNSKSDDSSSEARKSDDSSSETRKSDDSRSETRKSDDSRSENRKSVDSRLENRKSGNRGSDDRGSDARKSGDRRSSRKSNDRKSKDRKFNDKKSDDKRSNVRKSADRRSVTKKSDVRKSSDSTKSDDSKPDTRDRKDKNKRSSKSDSDDDKPDDKRRSKKNRSGRQRCVRGLDGLPTRYRDFFSYKYNLSQPSTSSKASGQSSSSSEKPPAETSSDGGNCSKDPKPSTSENEMTEVQIDVKMLPEPGKEMDWKISLNISDIEDEEEDEEEDDSDEEDDDEEEEEEDNKPKRQKLDSGIGEATTSGSSPDKSKTEEDSDPVQSPNDETADNSTVLTEEDCPDLARHLARRRRRIARGGDARRVRLSLLMKQAVRELPLPHALKKYVNLGRCFEF